MYCEKSDVPVVVIKSVPMNLGNKWEGKTWMIMHELHGLNTIQKKCSEVKGETSVKVERRVDPDYCNGVKRKRPERKLDDGETHTEYR